MEKMYLQHMPIMEGSSVIVLLLDLWRIFQGIWCTPPSLACFQPFFLQKCDLSIRVAFLRGNPFSCVRGSSFRQKTPAVCTVTTAHIIFFLQFQDEVRLRVGAARQRVSFLLERLEQTKCPLLLHLFEFREGKKELRKTNSREMPDPTICGGSGNGSRQGQPAMLLRRQSEKNAEGPAEGRAQWPRRLSFVNVEDLNQR